MGKRTATPTPAASAPKVAKVVKEADPFLKECAPLLKYFAATDAVGSGCRKMLQAAAPYALRTPTEERHPLQLKFVEMMSELVAGDDAKLRGAITAAEATIAAHEEEQGKAKSELAEVEAEVEAKKEVKEAKGTAVKEATQALATAKAELEAHRKKQEAMATEQKDRELEKEGFEKVLSEQLEKFKEFAIPAEEEDQAVQIIVKKLQGIDASDSLSSALPSALKTNPRSVFAEAVVTDAERVFKEKVAALSTKIGEIEGEVSEQAKAVAAAEEVVQTAQSNMDTAFNESIAAENVWVGADSKVFDLKQALKRFDPKSMELAKGLDMAKSSLTRFLQTSAQFDGLRDRSNAPKPEVAETVDEPMREVVAEVVTEVVSELVAEAMSDAVVEKEASQPETAKTVDVVVAATEATIQVAGA